MAFIDIEVNRGLIYLKPDMQYTIKLPEKQVKATADKLNPYFELNEFYIGILNHDKTELNYQLRHFDDLYDHYIIQHFNRILKYGRAAKVDTMIELIDSLCPGDDPYFVDYKKFQFIYLRHLAYERDKYYVIDKYFLNKPILIRNTAYTLLFSQLFDGFLPATGKIDEIAYQIIVTKRLSRVKQILNEFIPDANLQELVLLKGLHDGFFAQQYPANGVLAILDSIASTTTNKIHSQLIENAKYNITKLLEGYPPPNFTLPNDKDIKVNLKQFKGKFVYLNFFTMRSYTCLQHIELLKNIHKTFGDDLKMISVIIDDNFEDVVNQLKAKECDWIFLHHDGSHDLINKYQVVVYPTYYLITPDGHLFKIPTIGPDEDFISYFDNVLKQWKDEEERRKQYEDSKNNH
jgi:peroxiredoxin